MPKKYPPSSLPFLQAQILEAIYLGLANGQEVGLEKLSEITTYKPDSKILANAINSLTKKRFLEGSLEEGFSVPSERYDFFKQVLKANEFVDKNYSKKILDWLSKKTSKVESFLKKKNISDLNEFGVVHKWYSYLEDFPYTLVEAKIKEGVDSTASLVVDPFCGSGTTLVTANMFHLDAIGFDSNPLMAFVSKVKTTWDVNMDEFSSAISKVASKFLDRVKSLENKPIKGDFLERMPKKELNQWLNHRLQQEVALLKMIIMEIEDVKIRNLFLLAMAVSCFNASNVALCPGTTFYPFREKPELWDLLTDKIIQMYEDLKAIQSHNNYGESRLIADTCLNASQYIDNNSIDFIITSPPYPNDLEYTRQTRLELYLLDFVMNMDDVQSIKRQMVRGSTKLIYKDDTTVDYVAKYDSVQAISRKIHEKTKDKNWGFDYPRMVKEYFGDMFLCLKEFYPLMKKDSTFMLVVGDQTIKGVVIPVGDILIEIAEDIGYKNCKKELFRMRRSTGHTIPLPEEIVVIEKG
ncbi:MAG: DNA methyltransferase [Syntrophaceticus sp.]